MDRVESFTKCAEAFKRHVEARKMVEVPPRRTEEKRKQTKRYREEDPDLPFWVTFANE